MKKRWFVLPLVIVLIITSMSAAHFIRASDKGIQGTDDEASDLEKVLSLYREFLNREQGAKTKHGDLGVSDIFRFDTQNDRDFNWYALYDMNGDGLPELHVHSVGPYAIITYRDGELVRWADFWSYARPLNNGTVLNVHTGGANDRRAYNYVVFDFYGNEQLDIFFEQYDANDEGEYDENSLFLFEGVEVSKGVWDTLTEKYLSIGDDQIEWFVYSEGELAF